MIIAFVITRIVFYIRAQKAKKLAMVTVAR
jgi:hypothetical protein